MFILTLTSSGCWSSGVRIWCLALFLCLSACLWRDERAVIGSWILYQSPHTYSHTQIYDLWLGLMDFVVYPRVTVMEPIPATLKTRTFQSLFFTSSFSLFNWRDKANQPNNLIWDERTTCSPLYKTPTTYQPPTVGLGPDFPQTEYKYENFNLSTHQYRVPITYTYWVTT